MSMPFNINMEKVYEFMEQVSDGMIKAYDSAVEFTSGLMGSLQNVITVFG